MNWLWDASDFLTRGHCGLGWTPWLKHLYQLSNFVIFFSYSYISLSLYSLYRKRKTDLPAPHLFALFSTFILLCGLMHLSDVIVFHWAPYRLFALLALLTAVVSATTASSLPVVVQNLMQLPSSEYLHVFNVSLQNEVRVSVQSQRELALRNEALRIRVKALEDLLKTNAWVKERGAAMAELEKILSALETCTCPT